MLNLNKKQVGALLKIISKDTMREAITTAHIAEYDGDIVLQATDGYVLAMVKLDKDDAQEHVGKSIRREAIEKWYKLATGKSRLDTRELNTVLSEDYAKNGSSFIGQYPDIKQIMDKFSLVESIDSIAFNADYAKSLQDLAGTDSLTFKLHGKLAPMIAKTEIGTFVLMPRKQ